MSKRRTPALSLPSVVTAGVPRSFRFKPRVPPRAKDSHWRFL